MRRPEGSKQTPARPNASGLDEAQWRREGAVTDAEALEEVEELLGGGGEPEEEGGGE